MPSTVGSPRGASRWPKSEAPRAADAPDAHAALDAEVPNAIAAMRWALASGADEAAADLVIAWGRYWFNTSRRADGRAWTAAALERAVDPDRRARLLLTRGVLAGARQRERFRADLQAALEYFRTTDDAVSIAECLGQLAFGHAWGTTTTSPCGSRTRGCASPNGPVTTARSRGR